MLGSWQCQGAGTYKGKKQERPGSVWRRAKSSVELKHRILSEERILERTTLQKALDANHLLLDVLL